MSYRQGRDIPVIRHRSFFSKVQSTISFVNIVAFALVIGAAAAYGIYYLAIWQTVDIPAGKPANISATILTLIFNITAVRLVVGIVLAIMLFLAVQELWGALTKRRG